MRNDGGRSPAATELAGAAPAVSVAAVAAAAGASAASAALVNQLLPAVLFTARALSNLCRFLPVGGHATCTT